MNMQYIYHTKTRRLPHQYIHIAYTYLYLYIMHQHLLVHAHMHQISHIRCAGAEVNAMGLLDELNAEANDDESNWKGIDAAAGADERGTKRGCDG